MSILHAQLRTIVLLFWFLELDSQVQQAERRYHAETKADTPRSSQVVLTGGKDDDHRHQRRDHETHVDGEVRGEDEPPVSVTSLQFSSRLCACHRASRVLSSNSNTEEETICGECGEHATGGASTIRAGSEGCEDNEDDGRDEEGISSRPVITEVSEEQLSNHGAGESN